MNTGRERGNKLDQVVAGAQRQAMLREQDYRARALTMYPWICGRCAREFTRENLRELTVHHRDHDHDNNPADGSNWELLCVYCHDNEHARYVDHAQHRSFGVIALIQIAFDVGAIWIETKDGDPSVRSLFNRHYSRRRYKDGRQPALFMGPGEKVVLRTPLCDAICGWRKFISGDNQEGINCAFFRSEAQKRILSSTLLLESQKYVWERWP